MIISHPFMKWPHSCTLQNFKHCDSELIYNFSFLIRAFWMLFTSTVQLTRCHSSWGKHRELLHNARFYDGCWLRSSADLSSVDYPDAGGESVDEKVTSILKRDCVWGLSYDLSAITHTIRGLPDYIWLITVFKYSRLKWKTYLPDTH